MTFSIDSNPAPNEVADALNYILGNMLPGLSSNTSTGQVTNNTGGLVSYLYQYLHIKYADSFDGSLNFSDLPTGRGYYGLYNTSSNTETNDPSKYLWSQVTGGFGTTKQLYYMLTGGRQIQMSVSTTAPAPNWFTDSGPPINLDLLTSAATSSGLMGFGMDGEDGNDAFPLPGPAGAQGPTGSQGGAGPATYLEAEVIEPDFFAVPGTQGPQGNPGIQGVAGLSGIGMDGFDGEDGFPIPGPAGPPSLLRQLGLALQYDQFSPTVGYLGTAATGSTLGSSVWAIQQITISNTGSVSILWANGSNSNTNIWNNRYSFTYS